MHLAVAIASKGRPVVLGETLAALAGQTRAPDSVWVSVTAESDLPPERDLGGSRVLMGPSGLPTQRNAIIDAIGPEVDLLVFLDDDVELHPGYLARAESFAASRPAVVLFSGLVVADGAATGEIDRGAARAQLADRRPQDGVRPDATAYGCNMVVRSQIARQVRFDETLPLYGWLEDLDFSVRAARVGRVLNYDGCELVHLGLSSGRESGLQLGFQQIVHPVYLRRKGVLSRRRAAAFLGRALAANLVKRSSGRVDRPGRLRGNLIGLRAVLARRPDPLAVLELS